jgi:hypothetical protein
MATYGKATADRADAFGFKWDRTGRSSKHIPFDWSGPDAWALSRTTASIYSRIRQQSRPRSSTRLADWSGANHPQPTLGFSDARVLNALANYERLSERLLGERRLVVGEVRLAPDLRGVRFPPGVLAVGMRREIERLAGPLLPWPRESNAMTRWSLARAEMTPVAIQALSSELPRPWIRTTGSPAPASR